MNITDCVFELEKLNKENAALRERLARLVEEAKDALDSLRYVENAMPMKTGYGVRQQRIESLSKAIAAAELSGKTGELKSLQAAAENILFKRKQNATLTDADFEWLERAAKEV